MYADSADGDGALQDAERMSLASALSDAFRGLDRAAKLRLSSAVSQTRIKRCIATSVAGAFNNDCFHSQASPVLGEDNGSVEKVTNIRSFGRRRQGHTLSTRMVSSTGTPLSGKLRTKGCSK